MSGAPIRVLVIEDDEDYLEIIRLCLDEPDQMGLKFSIERADRLEPGLHLLETQAFDAVLLDLMLPDSQGIGTLLQILSVNHDVPILVMTNVGDEEKAFEAMRLGAQDYMVKNTSDSRLLKRAIWYAIERRKATAQIEGLISGSPDAMVVVDEGRTIRYVNPGAEMLFGRKSVELLGQAFHYPVNRGETSQLTIEGPDKSQRMAEMRVTEIQWRGRPARLAVIRDITELQRVEQLKAEIKERRKIDEMKDELLRTVSHELRTPLTIVKGAIDNLKEGIAGPLQPRQDEIVGIAHRNIARLTKMINNLLDLSRLESGQIVPRRTRVNAVPVIEDIVAGLRLSAQSKNVSLDVEAPADLPEVYADPEMLGEVLTNLIDNALRYALSKVVVKAGPGGDADAKEGRRLLFEVKDDGAGIAPDRLGALFNKFVQVSRTADATGYRGTGLGLAICKEILALHNGKIWAECPAGGGTRFLFLLPEYTSQPLPRTPPPSSIRGRKEPPA